jgi:ActR/RegA family two-component response regulator
MIITPSINDIEHICNIATAVITICSVLANFLPHPEKVEGILANISKFVNALALNITKLKKEG